MKQLIDLGPCECKFAVTTSEASDKSWSHAHLAGTIGGGAFKHGFCGKPTASASEPYCAEHKARCHRGHGKDARSLEEMIYAIDKSQYRGGTKYADHTEPMDVELQREREPFQGSWNEACRTRKQEGTPA